MKKIYIIGLILCVIIIFLFIFRKNFDYHVVEHTYIEFFEYYENCDNATLIKNSEQYKEYLDVVSTEKTDVNFIDKITKYDDKFFKDNMLIVIYYEENTSSTKLSIDDIKYKDTTVNVVIKRKNPQAQTNMMKQYAFIIELPRNDKYSSVEYTFIEERMWFK